MSSVYLFTLHVILIGLSIAAASYHFSALIGAPRPHPLPVPGGGYGAAVVVPLWLVSGPVVLLRHTDMALFQRRPHLLRVLVVAFALIWAFCLGIVALEIGFRLFVG